MNNNKRVQFEKIVDVVNYQTCIRKPEAKDLRWYKTDEIKKFRRDAHMISISFIKQRARRKIDGFNHPLRRAKTISVLGLENRINYKRRLKKEKVIRKVLKAQNYIQKKYSYPTSEIHLAMVSSAASLSARRQALEDGKSVSQGSEPDLSLARDYSKLENTVLSNFDFQGNKITDSIKEQPYIMDGHNHHAVSMKHKLKEEHIVCNIPKAA